MRETMDTDTTFKRPKLTYVSVDKTTFSVNFDHLNVGGENAQKLIPVLLTHVLTDFSRFL